jgi:hypothetical protein
VSETDEDCRILLGHLNERASTALSEFEGWASSRTADDNVKKEIVGVLMRWFIHGRAAAATPDRKEATESEAAK